MCHLEGEEERGDRRNEKCFARDIGGKVSRLVNGIVMDMISMILRV